MRKTFVIVILLCIVYFIGGWTAVHFGIFDKNLYFSYAGIVGALASVVGLLSFIKPPLTKTDIQEIEIELLRSLAETSGQLKKLEKERTKTKEELGDLELRRKEMELSVKKASLALFLKEQYSHHEKKIAEEIRNNPALNEILTEIQEISKKLDTLEEEIEVDPNVAQLREIMMAATRRQFNLEEALENASSLSELITLSIIKLSKTIRLKTMESGGTRLK